MDQTALKKLQKEWYKKLADSGFKDIESEDNEYLLQWEDSYFSSRYSKDRLDSQQSYYRAAEHFLNTHKFKNSLDKFIWEQHSKGVTIRETVRLIRQQFKIKAYKDLVENTNKRLKVLMIDQMRRNDE